MEMAACYRSTTYLRMMINAVCIGQDPVPVDHKSTAGGRVLSLALPRQGVVRLTVGTEHLRNVYKLQLQGDISGSTSILR